MKKLFILLFTGFQLLLLSIPVKAQYTDIVEFNGTNTPKGESPYGDVTRLGHKLYGMTKLGGKYNKGIIFSVDTNGNGYTDLLDFWGTNNGEYPWGSLIFSDGKFYGMTNEGGTSSLGNIFSIDTNGGGYKDLLNFNGANGKDPYGSLLLSGEKLYGVTQGGGANSKGNVFKIDTNGNGDTNLFSFNGTNGIDPKGSLILSGSKLYGMIFGGGANSDGTIFSIDTNGNGYTDLLNFNNTNGAFPYGSLTLSGNILYGATPGGGTSNS